MKESLIRLQLQRLKLLRHDGRSYEGAELRKKSAGSWAFTTGRCSGCFGRSWRKSGRMMNPPSGKVKIPLFLNAPSKVCKLSAYRHSAICCVRGKGKCPVPSGAVAEEGGYFPPLQAECQMRSWCIFVSEPAFCSKALSEINCCIPLLIPFLRIV